MKRILIVSMSAGLGGIEKSMIHFLSFISSMPDTCVELMLWKCKGELLDDIPSSVRIIPSPAPGDIKSILLRCNIFRIFRYMSLKWQTRKGTPWLSFPKLKGKYDVAISYTQDGYSPYYVIDCVDAEKKYLWYHHGAYIHSGAGQLLDIQYYPRFTNVVAVSESIRDILIREVPTCQPNIIVINNLIDEKNIIRCSKGHCEEFSGIVDKCRLVTVGRLSYEKGQLRALEVANALKMRNFNFLWIFVGEGPDKEACQQKVREYGLMDSCKFVGAKTNPYPYFRCADIYVAPSYVEADPVTIQEALILGKPIIASKIESIVSALSKNASAVLMDFDLADSVAESIIDNYNSVGHGNFKAEGSFTRNIEVRRNLETLL